MANFQNVVTKVLDANRYASKKTLAQGMLDIALLTANASQLKYILQVGKQHEFYTLMVTLISISIVLQVAMGTLALTLNLLRDCRLHRPEFRHSALWLNYVSLVGAFIVSVVNLMIAVFNPRPTHPMSSVHYSVLVAALVLLVCGGAAAQVSNGTESPIVELTTATPVTTSEAVNTKAAEEEERPASVEQVPPPAPLITESAKQGYRMPGLYALGTQPFYLQRDPVTGAVDFSIAGQGSGNNHRFSSKIAQPSSSSHDLDDYDDVIAINDEEESFPIDRKDTLGPNSSNDIKLHGQVYQNDNHKDKKQSVKERFPLISSSYANTKVQGMGVTKAPSRYSETTSHGPSPSYYNIRDVSSTTDSILDFWPQKSTSTPTPIAPDTYDFYEEMQTNEEEIEKEEDTEHHTPTTMSTTAPKDIASFQTPVTTYTQYVEPTTHKPFFQNERPDAFGKPYEEPFRPIYGTIDGPELSNENVAGRPKPPSIYDQPPADTKSPISQFGSNRPISNSGIATENKNPMSVFSPPYTYSQQPGIIRQPPSPSLVQKPPTFEPPKYHQEDRIDVGEQEKEPVRPLKIDSQGWKQATYTEMPLLSTSTSRIHFPQADSEETFTTLPNSPSLRQPVPQGYEPLRPVEYMPLPEQRPRPGPVEASQNIRPPATDAVQTNFDNGRPHFERPGLVPVRHQFDPANIPDGVLRLPGNIPNQGRPPQPPRRSDTRPPSFSIQYGPKTPQPYLKFNNQRHKDHTTFMGNNPENLDSPVVLPQFRPNAKIPPNSAIGNFRVPSHPNRRPPPGYLDRLHPPPPPPVGRRVGSQVSTLQMMKHGAFPRLSAREDAPFPNLKPPMPTYEVRPVKYGPQQQGSEERPVFVVYANSGENQQQSDILVGTHGPQRPLPPSHLTEEEPVLSKKPTHQQQPNPVKAYFPYALEKPAKEPIKNESNINEEIEKDEEVNIIPNLQDYMPLGVKATTQTVTTDHLKDTSQNSNFTPVPTENIRLVSIVRPKNKNEFTVSAVMHTGSHLGGAGTGSVMVVDPKHRNTVQVQQPTISTATGHESFNFQAPFQPSANVAPSPGNGWSAVKGTTENNESLRPGTVDRADVMEELHNSFPHASGGNKFDIENFKPELIGGFKPIYSFPEESAPEKKAQQQTTEREEKRI